MRVAIAGFGIGGAALSIALARDGHDVTVYEQAATLGPVGAGFLLQPSGQAVLDELGLLAAVAATAWPIRRFRAESAPGRILSELRYDRGDPKAHALGVSRGRLFTMLRTTAEAAGVRIETGIRILAARERRDAVEPLAADGTGLDACDLLVGADGMRSAVRRSVDPDARLVLSPFAALWGIGPTSDACAHALHQQARGVDLLAGHLPVGEREAAVFWGLRASDLESWRSAGYGNLVERVGAVLPEAAEVFEAIGDFDRLLLARYGHAVARRTHTARIALIGDAAHACPPHLGQGANLALLDAAALAASLRTSGDIATGLARWDRGRRFQNARYAVLSRALSPFFQSSHGWLGRPRDLGLPVMTRLPPTRAVMERVLAGRG
jgi:2-polyprenyl-6-methoxyphenol hydroxylase-like FAD-dependent oxidoreductase